MTGQGPDLIEAGGERLHIPEIGRLWGRSKTIGAGICTVGDGASSSVCDACGTSASLPLAVMLDSVGSAAVESLAEYANDLLCQAAIPAGVKVTNRISPGYAGWDTGRAGRALPSLPGRTRSASPSTRPAS